MSVRVQRGPVSPARWASAALLVCTLVVGADEARARIAFNDHGQIIDLQCDPAALVADERIPCGADGPTWVNVHDEQGWLKRQLLHEAGRLLASREFSATGVVIADEQRIDDAASTAGERRRRRTYDEAGRLRAELLTQNGRPLVEREFDANGVEIRQTEWDARGQRSETRWYPNRVMQQQVTPADYRGRAAQMVQQYWENGQLRQRGMVDGQGRHIGLVQTFHPTGALATEAFYDDGRLARERHFDQDARLLRDDEYRADGTRRSSIQR